MDLMEVVERSTGARMSRTPKIGDFIGIDHRGRPKYSDGQDCGTTLFNSYPVAAEWIVSQGLSLTHDIRPIEEDRL